MKFTKICITVLVTLTIFTTAYSAQYTYKVGAAARCVNPTSTATPIGHGSKKPITNFHNDLKITVTVIEDQAGQRIAWMGWDNCYADAKITSRVKKTVEEKYNISPDTFCINASHTHSAPPVTRQGIASPELFDPNYAEFFYKQAVAVVGDAIEKMAPARLQYSKYICTSVAINRRKNVDGEIKMLPNPGGTVDQSVQVITATNKTDEKISAIIVKYACHPVTVGPNSLGGDYPSFMRQFVKQRHPEATVTFLQGCGANARPQIIDDNAEKFIGISEELAKRFGRDLALSVEWALAAEQTEIAGPIRSNYKVIDLPLDKPDPNDYLKAIESERTKEWGQKWLDKLDAGEKIVDSWPYHIQTFTFGLNKENPFALVAIQGETFAEYGLNIQKQLPNKNTIVLGYSNQMNTYVCTADAIAEGGYEPNAHWYNKPTPTRYAPQAEKIIINTAVKMTNRQ
jgi:hypothetical protein